ncbi:MAG: hypothetical protein NVSMB23_03390 [Myxococcales bacterium]
MIRPTRPSCLAALLLSLSVPLVAAGAAETEKEHEKEKAREAGGSRPEASQADLLYALGAILGQKISGYAFTAAERSRVEKGFEDAAARRKLRLADPDLEEWGARVDAMLAKRANPQVAATKDRGRAFAAAAARDPGAVRLASGAVLRTLTPGAGKSPLATSRVKVNYAGKLIDGTPFDSSADHGGPSQFPLNGVIPCWTEGVQKMKQGEKARLVCPSSAAYGDQGRPPKIPGGSTLVFEIELLGVE